MAKRPKKNNEEQSIPFTGDNTASAYDVGKFISEIEGVQQLIDLVMSDAREACAPHRDNIKAIKLDAHEATNVSRAAMNHVIASRRSTAKVAQRLSRLSEEHRIAAEKIRDAMPDQPRLF